jgi:Protein of Unknown function (DUF2784)
MLADLILTLHFAIVLFNIGGLIAIWLGAWLGWGWVRNRVFRAVHLGLILFIVAEALLGVTCPLTTLEDWMRGEPHQQGFIARWVSSWLFYDAPAWVFVLAYSKFGALVAATWVLVPPRKAMAKL